MKGVVKRPAFPGIILFVAIQFYNGEPILVSLRHANANVIRGDEPMVVLDTLTDWRFAHNVGHLLGFVLCEV